MTPTQYEDFICCEAALKAEADQRASGTDEPLVGRQTEHFVCPDCGRHVGVDEDGCCAACGTECTIEPCNCPAPNTGGHVPTAQREKVT